MNRNGYVIPNSITAAYPESNNAMARILEPNGEINGRSNPYGT